VLNRLSGRLPEQACRSAVTMPKDRPPKAHHSAVAPKPYARPASAARPTGTGAAAKSGSAPPQVVGPALNKDFGQHLLVNPLVVNGIIEKVRPATCAGRVQRPGRVADAGKEPPRGTCVRWRRAGTDPANGHGAGNRSRYR